MAQRNVEAVIGRLVTDEQFRADFLANPEKTLFALCERGMEMSKAEIAALVNTDPAFWSQTAEGIDPRLQKVSLRNNVA